MIRQLHRRRGEKGFTLAELVMVAALIALLSTMALPVAKFTVKRRKETELRLALRLMRNAIDEHKRLSDQGLIPIELGGEGYPEDLEVLVEGVDLVGQETKRRFLRRIPFDPMTGEQEWGKRSYQDEPDSDSWGGENLYDVYSLSDGTAIDATKYKDW
jgi:general secretion pathway protein G